jgi:hypothetical protein
VDLVAHAAGKTVTRRHDLTAPQGVRGRNSDNTKLRLLLGWEPQISLEDGLARTYAWIRSEMAKHPGCYALDGHGAEREIPIHAEAQADNSLTRDTVPISMTDVAASVGAAN